MRWSLSLDDICKCDGIVAHEYERPATYCLEQSRETDDDIALWFIDDPRQLTLHTNWNADTLGVLLDRTDVCSKSKTLAKRVQTAVPKFHHN